MQYLKIKDNIFTLVDDVTATAIANRKLSINNSGYASFTEEGSGFYLAHYVLLGKRNHSRTMQVDHINGDKLDNRWSNLQYIPTAANTAKSETKHRYSDIQSKYRGVWYDRSVDRWIGGIGTKIRKQFSSEFEAAMGRDYLFRKTFPGVAFNPNVREVVLDEQTFDLIRLTPVQSKENAAREVWIKEGQRRGKPQYTVYFRTTRTGRAKQFITTDLQYARKWFNILNNTSFSEGSETN